MFERSDDDSLHVSTPGARASGGVAGKGSSTARLGPSPAAIARAMMVQLKQAGAGADPEAGLQAVAAGPRGGGQPLPTDLQTRFETSLGADLSSVRVHTDDHAASTAAALGARAFAFGNDVFLGAGEYQPGSHDGALLLAHEVAHTVQQTHGAPQAQTKLAVSTPGDHHEVEADTAAAAMVAGRTAAVSALGGGAAVQRQVSPGQAGAGTYEAVRSCREVERADAASRAPTAIPERPAARDVPLGPIAHQLAASFRAHHVDATHNVPSEGDILSALQAYVSPTSDLSQPFNVEVRAPTGIWDGRDDSTYHVILRFAADGPAQLLYANNGASVAAQSATRSQADTTGGGVSLSVPPAAVSGGSSSATGRADSDSAATSHGVGHERWRMNLRADASWQRRDDWGRGATGWPFVRFGRVGHVEFNQEGPLSPCSSLAGNPPVPNAIAAPAAVGAPALAVPALNNTAQTTDATSQVDQRTVTTNRNLNVNYAVPTPTAAQQPVAVQPGPGQATPGQAAPGQGPAPTQPGQLPAPSQPPQLPAPPQLRQLGPGGS